MPCRSCQSNHQHSFNGEVAVHSGSGMKGLDMPIVWVFPKVTVCLSCGEATFQIPENRLLDLQEGNLKRAAGRGSQTYGSVPSPI
jgi:hypothetical protein